MKKEPEICSICGCPTGKSGEVDDALFCDYCNEGPLCGDCHEKHINECDIMLDARKQERYLQKRWRESERRWARQKESN